MSYRHELRLAGDAALEALRRLRVGRSKRAIPEQLLQWGGEGEPARRKPVIPTEARSEFLAHRALGDWAERQLARALTGVEGLKAIGYGKGELIAAGDEGFRDFYLAGLEETRRFGKRPDLLVVASGSAAPEGLSNAAHDVAESWLSEALAAIEVRSSKLKALKYMEVRGAERAGGRKSGREAPSFTVKVEDLRIVYRWLERTGVPQAYVQVFLDSAFGLSFLDVLSIVAGGGFTVEMPEASQAKPTLYIPITAGARIGTFSELPSFAADVRESRLGRVTAFVKPEGGRLALDAGAVRRLLKRPQ